MAESYSFVFVSTSPKSMLQQIKQPQDYAGVIFDCDGTLTDSMPVHFRAWQKTMASYGIDFPEAQFYQLAGMPTKRIIRLLADQAGKSVPIEQATREKEAAFMELLPEVQPLSWVYEIAESLRGKVPIAVASGGLRISIMAQLKQIGCEDWFNAIVTAEDTERHKPEPDVFLKAAEKLCVNPMQCLVYEDADLGIAAAKAAGMDWIDIRFRH